tara:strand:- start:59 stop:1411 length:1353 start_codon:yes stop_codon:yes gene_type:complete
MNSKSNYSNINRPVGHIDLRKIGFSPDKIPAIAAMIIGYRGNGIKRYTSSVVGGFVRLQSDMNTPNPNTKTSTNDCHIVYISGRTVQDVQKIAMMINQDILAHKNQSVSSSRPTLSVPCPQNSVSIIIGIGGNNIKSIMRLVGNGCYIIHNNKTSMFDITANTPNSCILAGNMIKQTIINLQDEKVHTPKQSKNSTPIIPEAPQKPLSKGSRYSLLADLQSDEDDLTETESVGSSNTNSSKSSSKKTKRSPAPNIAKQLFYTPSQGESETNKKNIRIMLSKKLNSHGDPLYPDYTIWDKTTNKYVVISGASAVPWDAVDKFIRSFIPSNSQITPSLSHLSSDAFPEISSSPIVPTLERTNACSIDNPPITNENAWTNGNFMSVISSDGVVELNQRSQTEAKNKMKTSSEEFNDPWEEDTPYYNELSFQDYTKSVWADDYTPIHWDENSYY